MENAKKRYIDFIKIAVGVTDIASCMVRSCDATAQEITLAGDGYIFLRLCPEGILLPEFYSLAAVDSGWIWLYDDSRRIAKIIPEDITKPIRLYKAGNTFTAINGVVVDRY